jgi:hypothetical protein
VAELVPRAAPSSGSADPAEVFVRTLKAWQPKHRRIAILIDRCETLGIFTKFLEADSEANRLQTRHYWTVGFAVFPGGIALGLAILQLYAELPHRLQAIWVETALIGVSVLAVLQGLLFDWHKRWLVARYQAERLRLLIFRMAIDPGLWRDEEPRHGDWPHWIKPRIARIEGLNVHTIAHEAERDARTALPAPSSCMGISEDSVAALIDFYSATWLDSQLEYFQKKVHKEEGRVLDSAGLVNVAFAVSIGLVVIHITLEFANRPNGSRLFLMLSALVPALFTSVRTYRSAREASRNAARASARRVALSRYSDLLHGEDHDEKPKPEDRIWFLFTTLALSEALLESEQREWLRLMLEAEWIG